MLLVLLRLEKGVTEDFSQQPPAQELIAKDLHGNEWKFRHIFRGIYMGTITGISDLDPVRWPNSHWRSVKVGWDESTAGQRQPRVSLWEIEPLTTFPMYPSPFPFRLKRPWPTGLPSLYGILYDFLLCVQK
ncbi:hypothetical protein GW17_00048422 [Ensete ventricosum]|uniref:Auxin response factor domain-containing protein n=1 Tax=Ensete ventricosum TaxID=4639 RepID=A0A427ARU0_ENSVE|nr:hypothetical protein B296_00022915 [Ensete ventricosum]RWV89428.1 hypothetical protein GW17_00048422 [Ensete ventricosum]RZR82147.1 hypothetical protein BHM03_00008511 [Ensete ventricosum]